MAHVEGIWTTEYSARDMRSVGTAKLLAGVGIEGDRYATAQGTYSLFKEPGRQLTILSAEGAETALAAGGITLDSLGKLRRNIIVRGLSGPELLDTVGHIIKLGEIELFVHRNCVPCAYNEAKNGSGLMNVLWDDAGVNAEIVRGGVLRVGDRFQLGPKDEARIKHGKDEAFFIRPKKRTVQMVHAGRRKLADMHKKLLVTDPTGVERAAAAYRTLGLSFWPRAEAFREPKAEPWVGLTVGVVGTLVVLGAIALPWVLSLRGFTAESGLGH